MAGRISFVSSGKQRHDMFRFLALMERKKGGGLEKIVQLNKPGVIKLLTQSANH